MVIQLFYLVLMVVLTLMVMKLAFSIELFVKNYNANTHETTKAMNNQAEALKAIAEALKAKQ